MADAPHDTSNHTLHNAPRDIQGISNRSSIDLSLELEQQLDSESLPPDSPRIRRFPNGNNGEQPTSLDPHVLAHIVTQLRESLIHLSQERDDLVQQLAESHSRAAEFKEALALCTEQCAALEKDLGVQKKKNQDDEEAITLLRGKVEESRRGLMRLQSERNAESKRMTLDLTHARAPTFVGPRSSHRASFTPLTGSGQAVPSSFRRSSSTTVVENDSGFAEFVAGLPGSTTGQVLLLNDSGENISAPPNRRRSMFAHRAPSQREGHPSTELDSVRQELAAARAELEETRHELSESNEAREASETCVKALRDFIAQSGAGDSSLQLPPLPSDLRVKDVEPEPKQKTTSWGGLKLWRVDTNASATSTTTKSNVPAATRKSIDSYRTASSDSHEIVSPSTAVPLRNKFGAFFTRGTSINSVSYPPPRAHLDEPTSNGSDVSSSAEERSEPTSPPTEKPVPVLVQEPLLEDATVREHHDFPPDPGDGNGNTVKVVSL